LFSSCATQEVFPALGNPYNTIYLGLVEIAGILDVGNVRLIGSICFNIKED
jgi:hypothetical protein